MSDLETRVHDAFESVHVPQAVRDRTMQAIETKRAEEEQSDVEQSDVVISKARKSKRGFRSLGFKIAIAACLLVVVIGAGGFLFTALTPTAYVGIDVNPSIELGINRFNRVVETTAYNDDGQAVLDQAQVKGMAYVDALDSIEDAMSDQGYLQSDSVVEVSVVCDEDDLYSEIESACTSCFDESEGEAHCSRASSEEHHEASSCDMGMGKYRIYQALVSAGVDITLDEASNMSMSELYSLADEAGVDVQWGCGEEHDSEHSGHHSSDDESSYNDSYDYSDNDESNTDDQGYSDDDDDDTYDDDEIYDDDAYEGYEDGGISSHGHSHGDDGEGHE